MKPKPPIGLMRRQEWIECRIDDIYHAINRYRESQYLVPLEWVEELAEHLREMRKGNQLPDV